MANYKDKRPDVPRAAGFHAAFCDSPSCGLHIIALDKYEKPICEVVISASGTRSLVGTCQDFLYDKATRRTDK